MKIWAVLALALGLRVSSRASEENVRTFRAIDPNQLDAKVPAGYGKVFVEAGRQNNIDPLILAAISAHELLNRRPFKGHCTLASIAPIYCASDPANWKKSVHQWSLRLMPG
jgi:hypothetical protein